MNVKTGEPRVTFVGSEWMEKLYSVPLLGKAEDIFISFVIYLSVCDVSRLKETVFPWVYPPNSNMAPFPLYNSAQLCPLRFSIFRQGKKLLFRSWIMVSFLVLCIHLHTLTHNLLCCGWKALLQTGKIKQIKQSTLVLVQIRPHFPACKIQRLVLLNNLYFLGPSMPKVTELYRSETADWDPFTV